MLIDLMVNSSENNAIGKNLRLLTSKSCTLKKSVSIMEIEIELQIEPEVMENVNYVYIPQFKSYYFVTDITIFTGNIYELQCYKDVLQSYMNDILSLRAVIDKSQEVTKANMFIDDNSFILENRMANQIYTFPNGFNNSGEFILITVGG